MHEVERVAWTAEQRELAHRIDAHPFERADHALDFTRRLARDRGWSIDFARGAVREYRRFCFLAMIFETPVTPSEEVDEVWHQHLTYSRDYWEVWCGEVLRQRLHHDPTEGGAAEQGRYRMQYADTLARYEGFFGPPDPLFWPATHRRFRKRPRYRIVDSDRVLTLRRPALRGWLLRRAGLPIGLALTALATTPQPASALPLNPFDWTAGPFLTLYISLAITAFLVAHLVRDRLRSARSTASMDTVTLFDLAYLSGGPKRAADTVIVGLIEAGAAKLATPSGRIVVEDRTTRLPPEFEPFRGAARGVVRRSDYVTALKPRLKSVKATLIERSLAPSRAMLRRSVLATLIVVGPVILLGVAKMIVGSHRDKPIGFLAVLTIIVIVLTVVMLLRRPTRTKAGDAVLAHHTQRFARAARAPREGELLFAFALGGAAVLAGTPYEAYGRAAPSSGDGGGGSCGSDGGGGSGCGGGGCGGCGGGGD